ncbi:IS5 family transposase [Embleya sp. NPDC127516]|uniref:IS5 family transposase n=1 Tax=Embleya sp. NPDC127516 TaxID=3363990 RepID=UPI00382E76A8
MTDAEWVVVRGALPMPRWLEGRGGQPEAYCHREMIDAVRYLVDNGIKWRAMPADFPPWTCVYAFFRRWRDQGLTGEFHDRLRARCRTAAGRAVEPTAGSIDAQSVKAAASVPSATRGYDGGKKVNGRKRHIVVDTLGLLLTVLVTAADVTDRSGARTMLARLGGPLRKIRLVWADGSYTGPLVDWAAAQPGIALTVVKRTDDTRGFTVLPRRWVVERTFGWLMRSRRLARDYETLPTSSEAIVHWSMSMLMSRRLARRSVSSRPQTAPPAAA